MRPSIRNKIRSGLFLSCLLCIAATSCLSYSYTGIAQGEKMPDQGIIGINRESLINLYGMPARIIALDGQNSKPPAESMGGAGGKDAPLADDGVVYIYRRMAQHRVILYERTRESTYAVYLKNGLVSEVKTTLTSVGDGISFSPVVPGGNMKTP